MRKINQERFSSKKKLATSSTFYFQSIRIQEKAQAMMVFLCEIEAERNEKKEPEAEANSDRWLNRSKIYLNSEDFMFKWALLQVNACSSERQTLSSLIHRETLTLLRIHHLEGRGPTTRPWSSIRKKVKFPNQHNIPLYLIAIVHDVVFRRALIDPGSSLNNIPISILEAVGNPRDRIVEQPVEVFSFGGGASFTFEYINIELIIGIMRAAYRHLYIL